MVAIDTACKSSEDGINRCSEKYWREENEGGILSQAKKQSDMSLGRNTILFSLGLQIYLFCFYMRIAGTFHRDFKKNPANSAIIGNFPLQRYMMLLFAACTCVGIRNTYRIVEYAMGKV
jgi:hypothetical protein